MNFGVQVVNPYGLLGDDDFDNVETKAQDEKKSVAKAKATKPVSTVAAGVEARMKGSAAVPTGGRGGRGDLRGARGGRGRGGRFSERPSADDNQVDAVGGTREPRVHNKSRGGLRHHDRRRFDDRHDGTGRGHEVEKRDGTGKGNWGAVGDEINPNADIANGKAENEKEGSDVEAEPEAPQMTLEEYEKKIQEERDGLNKVAKVEHTPDLSAFGGMTVYEKSDDFSELDLVEKTKNKKSFNDNKVRKEKELLETNFRVGTDSGRGRGFGDRGGRFNDRPRKPGFSANGFGGRGGFNSNPRGGRGGRRPSTGRGQSGPAPAIDDATAFPSLGGN